MMPRWPKRCRGCCSACCGIPGGAPHKVISARGASTSKACRRGARLPATADCGWRGGRRPRAEISGHRLMSARCAPDRTPRPAAAGPPTRASS
jgi:hypothetical protein